MADDANANVTTQQGAAQQPTLEEIAAAAAAKAAQAAATTTTTTAQGAPNAPNATPTGASQENMVPQSRVDALTAERYEARRRAEAAEQKANELAAQLRAFEAIQETTQGTTQGATSQTQTSTNGQKVYTQEDVLREAQRLAVQQAQELSFKETLDRALVEGRTAHQDFDMTIGHLTRGGPLPPTLLNAIVANDKEGLAKASDIVYALGKDLNEADRILSMPPERQAIALTRFALQIAQKANGNNGTNVDPLRGVSRAAAPIASAVGASSASSSNDLYDPNMPSENWFALRKQQLKQRALAQ